MLNIQDEISRELPIGTSLPKIIGGEPILYAFECALTERYTGKAFVYTAVNLITGKTEMLSRRINPLAVSGVDALAERLRRSSVAGASRFQADRPTNERITLQKANEILNAVFKKMLPQHGYVIRKEQIALSEQMLTEISRRFVTLAEAEVGTGKTLAYLVPAVIAKRGRLNGFWNTALYPKMQYADMSKMPIVIATSSIALQRAILTEYIPELSQILLESGVINTPLTAVLRKGKEHYVCERNLRSHLAFESNPATRTELERLLPPSEMIDLAELEITPHTKRKVCVSGRCFENCPYYESCGYIKFREYAALFQADIQVCNHNYLLADTLLRADGKEPLIPNYQTLIVDEAHKFLQAARTMYGVELSSLSAPDVLNTIDSLRFRREGYQSIARTAAKKLYDENAKLFRRLIENVDDADSEDDADRFTANLDKNQARCLRNMRDISERLMFTLRDEAFFIKAEELLAWVRRKYGANTDRIDLWAILAGTVPEATTRDAQKELMHTQVVKLHKAICGLPEIKRRADIELLHNQERQGGSNPAYQAMRRDMVTIAEVIWKKARRLLPVESASSKSSERVSRLLWELEQLRKQADSLSKHDNQICWLETGKDENLLCAIPKNLDKRLFDDQWGKGIPTIFTSGTLSAGGDFSHIKRTLGLERLGNRISESSKPSPFNHQENALLYISETMPFPDRQSKEYIVHAASEIEKLVLASNGHAAVLFTSYKVMDMVWEQFKKHGVPFPMFRLEKGGVREIERFKQSDGGVLFASGALWEGIDIPGDALSMLIIVKLPFAVPDPIGEYEQTLYSSMTEYKARVVVPEMLIKLKQGFGRLIRTETDSGVVAILDSRANKSGAYRKRVLDALPDCAVTAAIDDVIRFFNDKKSPEYFS